MGTKFGSARFLATRVICHARPSQVNAAAVSAPSQLNWESLGQELDLKSPLEIMDHVGVFYVLFCSSPEFT